MIFGTFVDKLVKNENIDRVFSFFMGLGLFYYAIILVLVTLMKKTPTIAPGMKNTIYTIPLFLIFLFYQKYLLKKFFDENNEKSSLLRDQYKKLSINISLFILLLVWPIYIIFFSSIKIEYEFTQIIQIIFMYTIGLMVFAGGIFALLYYFLRMGIILTGANICIGLHNSYNGMEFDWIPIYQQLFFDYGLPEYAGILITILQISLAIFAGKIEDLFS